MDKDIQELLDSFYSKSFDVKGEPLGKVTQFYPGATPTEEPYYKTYTKIDQYAHRLQQSIENRDVLLKEEETTEPTNDLNINSDENEEEDFNTGEIGKIFELKKIFSRLISLESFLNDIGDKNLIKLSSYTSEAANLFKLVINNIDKFIDQIDDIIVLFYEFLQISYKILAKIYNEKYDDNDDNQGDT